MYSENKLFSRYMETADTHENSEVKSEIVGVSYQDLADAKPTAIDAAATIRAELIKASASGFSGTFRAFVRINSGGVMETIVTVAKRM